MVRLFRPISMYKNLLHLIVHYFILTKYETNNIKDKSSPWALNSWTIVFVQNWLWSIVFFFNWAPRLLHFRVNLALDNQLPLNLAIDYCICALISYSIQFSSDYYWNEFGWSFCSCSKSHLWWTKTVAKFQLSLWFVLYISLLWCLNLVPSLF